MLPLPLLIFYFSQEYVYLLILLYAVKCIIAFDNTHNLTFTLALVESMIILNCDYLVCPHVMLCQSSSYQIWLTASANNCYYKVYSLYFKQTDNTEHCMLIPATMIDRVPLTLQKHTPIGYKCMTVAACKYLWRCAVEQQFFFT